MTRMWPRPWWSRRPDLKVGTPQGPDLKARTPQGHDFKVLASRPGHLKVLASRTWPEGPEPKVRGSPTGLRAGAGPPVPERTVPGPVPGSRGAPLPYRIRPGDTWLRSRSTRASYRPRNTGPPPPVPMPVPATRRPPSSRPGSGVRKEARKARSTRGGARVQRYATRRTFQRSTSGRPVGLKSVRAECSQGPAHGLARGPVGGRTGALSPPWRTVPPATATATGAAGAPVRGGRAGTAESPLTARGTVEGALKGLVGEARYRSKALGVAHGPWG